MGLEFQLADKHTKGVQVSIAFVAVDITILQGDSLQNKISA